MDTTFELSESMPAVLKVEDMQQSKDDLSWHMLQSASPRSHLASQHSDHFVDLTGEQSPGTSPPGLIRSPSDPADFLRQKLQPPADRSLPEEVVESKLRASQLQVTKLTKVATLCGTKINDLKQAVFEAHATMRGLKQQLAEEKDHNQELREQLKAFASLQQTSLSARKPEDSAADDSLSSLRAKNRKLYQQVESNIAVFDQLRNTVANNQQLEQEIELQNKEIERLQAAKAKASNVVEQLLTTAQDILASSQTAQSDRVRGVVELMGSLASINFSDSLGS